LETCLRRNKLVNMAVVIKMEIPKKPFTNQKIGEIILDQGLITPQQLEEAIKIQKGGNKKRYGIILLMLYVQFYGKIQI